MRGSLRHAWLEPLASYLSHAQRYPNFKTVLWRMLRNIPRADEYMCL